jgi:adenylate cyclase
MTTGDVKRKLTAIFSADVEGYSRLMEEDELATVETLTSHKEIMRKMIRQFRGRVVDSTGDNLLAEFASVVDAVQCAVEVQQVLSAKNEALPENRRMNFRIGINSGDVIEEGELIYGDGVSVAARVESLAEGGGISISGTAFDQLGKKLPLGYEYLGEQTVKNIRKPVHVYRVLTEAEAVGKVIGEEKPKTKQLRGVAIGAVAVLIMVAGALAIWNFYLRPPFDPASEERMAFPLPDKPSIAVLPFDNMSGDPKQDYLADGITEQIINSLSRISSLFVIARNSTFTYKRKPVKVQQVSEELGVRYVLEGSFQKSGNRVRITAQLIDAIKGHHLWSENYDRDLKDIFALQDDITKKILTALQVKLTHGEQARVWAKGTDNLEAFLKFLEAHEKFIQMNMESNALARQMAKEAIALDPEYAEAYSLLGKTYLMDVFFGSSKSPRDSIMQAIKLNKKAIALDETSPDARSRLGVLYTMIRQHEKGIAEAEKAVALDPNFADAHFRLGFVLRFAGRPEEAIPAIRKAMRLNPYPPVFYSFTLGLSYLYAGRCEEAIAECEKALQDKVSNRLCHIVATVAYSMCGREEKARATAEELLRIDPKFSVKTYVKTLPYKNKSDIERYIAALRKAGLPETPPLPLPDKPSIAVLPFVNMSGDPKQEYFSDGITEEIITALSKTPKLFVIARNSTFTYKGKPVKVQQVGRELGVKYVLEGSVRKAEDKVRITAQLVDAKTGNHLWAERYDRELKEIFALQDEITKKIITALRVHLTEGEYARILDRHTNNIQAYMKILEGSGYFEEDKYSEAMKCFEEAISLDPQSASAHSSLSWAHLINVWFGPSATRKQSLKKAFELAEKCKALDHTHGGCYGALSQAYLMKRDYDKAISEGKKAVELDPNTSRWAIPYGWALRSVGRYEDALLEYERALRLNPLDKARPLSHICTTYNMMRRHEEAIETCKKVIELTPRSLPSYINLAVAYSELDQMDEAREAADKVLKMNPNFSMHSFEKTLPYKNEADRDLFVNGLRKAGLK